MGVSRRACIAAGLLLITLLTSQSSWARPSDWADILLHERRAREPIPVLSYYEAELDETMAYAIQRALVEKLLPGDRVAGYKAALTSSYAQTQFRVRNPVAGVFLRSWSTRNGSIVRIGEYRHLSIETGFALRLARGRSAPYPDVAALQADVSEIVPMVELSETAFGNEQRVSGLDLIAANACAGHYILGQPILVRDYDPNPELVTLSLGDRQINWGKGVDAMGDQWRAALWLANETLSRGWRLEPGQMLFTGALGRSVPAERGEYRVDFGRAGAIEFEVR